MTPEQISELRRLWARIDESKKWVVPFEAAKIVADLPLLLAAAEREAKLREVLRRLADLADVMADTANDDVCDEAIAEANKLLEETP